MVLSEATPSFFSPISVIQETWRHFLEVLHPDERQQLLNLLGDEYGEESQEVAQLTQHAERMAYPQFRQRLLKIADEEQAHLQWLREKILAQNPAGEVGGARQTHPLGGVVRGKRIRVRARIAKS